jgi:hypothetical protein
VEFSSFFGFFGGIWLWFWWVFEDIKVMLRVRRLIDIFIVGCAEYFGAKINVIRQVYITIQQG